LRFGMRLGPGLIAPSGNENGFPIGEGSFLLSGFWGSFSVWPARAFEPWMVSRHTCRTAVGIRSASRGPKPSSSCPDPGTMHPLNDVPNTDWTNMFPKPGNIDSQKRGPARLNPQDYWLSVACERTHSGKRGAFSDGVENFGGARYEFVLAGVTAGCFPPWFAVGGAGGGPTPNSQTVQLGRPNSAGRS